MRKKLPYLLPSILFFLGAPLIYVLCFREVPLVVSPQTTYITEPLTKDGKSIDWFRAIKERFEPQCKPEENGFRMVVAALGKSPYFEQSDGYWPELCKALDLDPDLPSTLKYEPPKAFLNREYLLWLEREPIEPLANRVAHDRQSDELTDSEKLHHRLRNEPWTADEFPFMARWIEENSPLLDLAAESLRKEYWFPPMTQGDHSSNGFFFANLTDGFYFRMNDRLGKKDVDGAWDDAMSLTRLKIHVSHDLPLSKPAREVVRHCHPTAAQRKKFLDDLEHLPPRATPIELLELFRFSRLASLEYLGPDQSQNLRLNWNVVAREINRFADLAEKASNEYSGESDPEKRRKIVDELRTRLTTPPRRSRLGQWLNKPITVNERSKEFAWAQYQSWHVNYLNSIIIQANEKSLDEFRNSLEKGDEHPKSPK